MEPAFKKSSSNDSNNPANLKANAAQILQIDEEVTIINKKRPMKNATKSKRPSKSERMKKRKKSPIRPKDFKEESPDEDNNAVEVLV